jgi:hypothetical protein
VFPVDAQPRLQTQCSDRDRGCSTLDSEPIFDHVIFRRRINVGNARVFLGLNDPDPGLCAPLERLKAYNMPFKTREIYTSANGDRWSVGVESESGRVFVKHEANVPSGGHTSEFDIEEFLNGAPDSPEHQALMQLVRNEVGKDKS